MERKEQKGFTRQNFRRASGGFTIIEVILFLALSGLFLTIAFTGIRGRTASIQFTDSMRSLQTFLVSEENKILNGVNSTTTSPDDCPTVTGATGESNSCILIGRVVSFGKNTSDFTEVGVKVLYGNKPSALDVANKDDLTLIVDSKPRPDDSTSTFGISWGTKFELDKSINLNDGTDTFDRVGWLRSPGSSRLIPIAFKSTVTDENLKEQATYQDISTETRIGREVETRFCFKGNSGRVASITIGDGTGASSLELTFDDPECK